MVGAGISTTAGIPDFRSKTGLFKQLQDKYGMDSPEEFFQKKTFLEKPEFFYEFCKIFDLSQVKPTLTHKFMKFMIDLGIVKYVFTQNIDGLELKAKIPKEKIVFAHGSFTEGHCSKCKIKVDINKINEGINNGKVVYCEICGGPCKPNVVFYGEDLSEDFYYKAGECRDCDLVIILGTSLQVYPFAKIPKLLNIESWKVVFNRDKVGNFLYNYLFSNTLFIQGTTDNTVIKFLKDVDLINDFKDYLTRSFGDNSIEFSENVKMIDIQTSKSSEISTKTEAINNIEVKGDSQLEDKK
jgi:NAD-dependent SIR2 family protein deacetylase